jgi:activator of 2-hydroxyglutaryl-CoA dehydratase
MLETEFVAFTEDPQIIGALGAALFAADKVK